MSDFHCLEIEFPNVEFSKFAYPNRKAEISRVHHAHLYTEQDEIEIRFFLTTKQILAKL